MCAKGNGLRQRGGLLPPHEGKDRGFVIGLAGPVVLPATVIGDEEDGGWKVVLGEDRNGVVNEVGEAVVEGDGNGPRLGERPVKRDDRNACFREEVHVTAERGGRHGDDRA